MTDSVRIRRLPPDLWVIGPFGAPSVADADPGVDTAVLEVAGGHLAWSLTSGQRVPAATLHDLDTAQEWLWALYGAEVALAADAYTEPVELPARPENPGLAAAVRRLAYAHWAARWWPASTVDGIPALDPALLDSEIAELTEFCESVVDGADATMVTGVDPDSAVGRDTGVREWTTSHPREYALAAGSNPADPGTGLVLDRGTTGWDWRYCTPGVVDASERAVSWELARSAGSTVVRVHAVAAPGVPADLPGHLRPHAFIRTPDGLADVALVLSGDVWSGEAGVPADSVQEIEIRVPGVGSGSRTVPAGPPVRPATADRPHPADPVEPAPPPVGGRSRTSRWQASTDTAAMSRIPGQAADAERRRAVRELARSRLRPAAAGPDAVLPGDARRSATGHSGAPAGHPLADIAPLRSETAAAEQDTDF